MNTALPDAGKLHNHARAMGCRDRLKANRDPARAAVRPDLHGSLRAGRVAVLPLTGGGALRCCVVRLRVRELRDLPGVDQFFMVRLRLRYRRAAAASGVDMAVCLVILMLAPWAYEMLVIASRRRRWRYRTAV